MEDPGKFFLFRLNPQAVDHMALRVQLVIEGDKKRGCR